MSADRLSLLLIEDNPGDARLLEEMLRDTGAPIELLRAENLAAGLEALRAGQFDAVLLDLSLPDSVGLETFQRLHDQAPHVPVVVLTGLNDERVALGAMQAGAQDYLVKGQVDAAVLLRAVRYAVERQLSEKALRQARDELELRVQERTAKLAESEARLREEARLKDEFMAMLGHELRNPLAPIRNAAHILGRIESRDKTLESMREIIVRQVTHMTRLVDDLLDVSRINRGKVVLKTETLDLANMVRTAAEDHRLSFEASGLSLEVRVPARALFVKGDSARLTQIIGNLLHNANKFTDRGGRVLLELTAKRGQAVIMVSDTGIGMETEMLGRVFQPFRQSERARHREGVAGLGLGLALVKGLAELHGGSVGACSEGPGKGSQFVVRLPLEKAAGARAAVTDAPLAAGRTLRILIVEDNLDAAASLQVLLELAGHQVAEAHTAKEGLAAAQQFRPEVVLCDIGLPGGMDGYDFARAARHDGDLKNAYLVAMTGFGQDEDRKRALEAGFDLHLTKPVAPEQLERVIAKIAAGDRAPECAPGVKPREESGRLNP